MNLHPNSDSGKQLILVVDDNEEMTYCIRQVLLRQGFRVITAADGNEGLAKIGLHSPDLILLDLMMPKRSGILILEYLRLEVEKPIPVIMMTASKGKRHRSYAEQLGVEDYFTKPFPIPNLVLSVERILGEQDSSN